MSISRRDFLGASAGGLILAFALPVGRRRWMAEAEAAGGKDTQLTAFLRIAPDDSVTVIIPHTEMGQGIWTTLPMLVAEELEADWSKIRVEHAPANNQLYANTVFHIQGTGGSTSTFSEFERLRGAGATARMMLIAAAAKKWKVAPETLHAENGFVVNGPKKLSFGQLAAAAGALEPPKDVKLKDAKDWKIIGKPHKRLDTPEKVSGKAKYGIDTQMPGLLTAVVERAPVFGGKVKSFKADGAMAVKGVKKVVQVPTGVAVVAEHTWAAQKGREALQVDWDLGPGADVDTDKLMASYRDLAKKPGDQAAKEGDVDAALAAKGSVKLEAMYEFPYLAHAPMEPLNCTVKLSKDKCEIWCGTQLPGVDQPAAAQVAGLKPEQVFIHTPFLGGGFGRRGVIDSHFVREGVEVAKAAGAPVKTVWTREDDIKGGYYRPLTVHRLEGAIDAAGKVKAWRQTIVSQDIPLIGHGATIEGSANSPYLANIPARLVTFHSPAPGVPVLWWRSVGSTHSAFAVESFIDELAAAGKRDPAELRRELLKGSARHLKVLETAADKAGWGKPPPAGMGRGVAVHESFGSIVAQVADVSVDKERIRVHRVVCAIDCGLAVNPDGVTAQMQSSIIYGLSAAMYGAVRIKGGKVQESNFDDYKVVRMPDAPKTEVIVISSGERMGGAGEPGTPPIAPAVANAVYSLTRKRLRTLPFQLS